MADLSTAPVPDDAPYHVSGLLVVARPGRLEECVRDLERLTGVEIHYRDAATGRLIVVQESASAKAQEEGFERIRRLPSVGYAALVEYRIAAEVPGLGNPEGAEER